MVIRDVLEKYRDQGLEGLMILSKALRLDKAYIYTHMDRALTAEEEQKIDSLFVRLKKGEPIQYILRERNFMGLDFYVDKGVLIPRNDTETLVEYLLDYMGQKSLRLLEIGFGSGAICLSLAHFCPEADIVAVDISKEAYKIAKINRENLGLENVELRLSNLFENVQGRYNIIVSNPPYITAKAMEELDQKVRHEPEISLYGGEDGLDFYRKISRQAGQYLLGGGLLIYEIGYDQGQAVRKILEEAGFRDIELLKDLSGQDRVVLGFWR